MIVLFPLMRSFSLCPLHSWRLQGLAGKKFTETVASVRNVYGYSLAYATGSVNTFPAGAVNPFVFNRKGQKSIFCTPKSVFEVISITRY